MKPIRPRVLRAEVTGEIMREQRGEVELYSIELSKKIGALQTQP